MRYDVDVMLKLEHDCRWIDLLYEMDHKCNYELHYLPRMKNSIIWYFDQHETNVNCNFKF